MKQFNVYEIQCHILIWLLKTGTVLVIMQHFDMVDLNNLNDNSANISPMDNRIMLSSNSWVAISRFDW